MSCCFPGSTAIMLGYQGSDSENAYDFFLGFYFQSDRPTRYQETYSTVNEKKKKGWPYTIQYILNWRLPIGAFRGQWNTTKRQNRTTVKNPNWLGANQLAIYKCSWEVEPGTTRITFNEWSERLMNPGSPDLKASAVTTGPYYLPLLIKQ